jgi:hypothetical protein
MKVASPLFISLPRRLKLLSPSGERLGEGVMQEKTFALPPSPSLSPKGQRNMRGEAKP